MPTSVMPKGVEHILLFRPDPASGIMPTSVMPKGVEHLESVIGAVGAPSDAHLCDAERR